MGLPAIAESPRARAERDETERRKLAAVVAAEASMVQEQMATPAGRAFVAALLRLINRGEVEPLATTFNPNAMTFSNDEGAREAAVKVWQLVGKHALDARHQLLEEATQHDRNTN